MANKIKIKKIASQILRDLPKGEIITVTAWIAKILSHGGGQFEENEVKREVKSLMKKMLPSMSHFYLLILQILQEMGGAGQKKEVVRRIAEMEEYTDEQLAVAGKAGNPIIDNRIGWARSNLVKTGYVMAAGPEITQGGQWVLTNKGQNISPQSTAPQEFTRGVNRWWRQNQSESLPQESTDESADVEEELGIPPEEEIGETLLQRVLDLSPRGFELFCGRLLRTVGFEKVKITPASKDGGCDGTGLLVINSFIATAFVFECKCWQKSNPVRAEIVRALRGKIGEGVAEKGAVITTSRFTRGAEDAAEKGSPIGLVDGNAIAELMQKHFLGVKRVLSEDCDGKKESLKIDESFFAQYEKKKKKKSS